MKDFLLKDSGIYIIAEVNGLELTLTCSDTPTDHEVYVLRSREAYRELKREINEIYDECNSPLEGYDFVIDELNNVEFLDKYFIERSRYCYCYGYSDIRDRDTIHEYLDEAWDKVWLMRNCCISERLPVHEASRAGMERIMTKYHDIPKDGYDDWECGYWNGIMGALRWVLGEDKNRLDT